MGFNDSNKYIEDDHHHFETVKFKVHCMKGFSVPPTEAQRLFVLLFTDKDIFGS